jgi:hypothetical protein
MTNQRRRAAVALLLTAAGVSFALACGGGSGDVTAPPGGTGAGAVDSIVLSVDSSDIVVGDTSRIVPVAVDANGQPVPGLPFTFTSSDPSVATVTGDGLVTAVDFGVADIEIALADAAEARAALRLSGGARRARRRVVVVPRIVVLPGAEEADVGDTKVFVANALDSKGAPLTIGRVTWTSSDPAVATIDANGTASALAQGQTTITALVSVGAATKVPGQATLTVGLCGGILKVAEWDASVSVSYSRSAKVGIGDWKVSQNSSATSRLTVDAQSGSGIVIWSGPVAGSVALDNSTTYKKPQGGIEVFQSEHKAGSILSGSPGQLFLGVTAIGHECVWTMGYKDNFAWEMENAGAPATPENGSTVIANTPGLTLGPKPEGGWILDSVISLPAMIEAAAQNAPPGSGNVVVKTLLGAGLIVQAGAQGVLGNASFEYRLTAIR